MTKSYLIFLLLSCAKWEILHFLTLSPWFSCVHVLLLPRPAILKPDLCDPLAQSRDLSNPLQILAVRVRVDLKVGLQDLNLLLRERRPHPLRLLLAVILRFATLCKKTMLIDTFRGFCEEPAAKKEKKEFWLLLHTANCFYIIASRRPISVSTSIKGRQFCKTFHSLCNSFDFSLHLNIIILTVWRSATAVQVFHVVGLAEDPVLVDAELLAGR